MKIHYYNNAYITKTLSLYDVKKLYILPWYVLHVFTINLCNETR